MNSSSGEQIYKPQISKREFLKVALWSGAGTSVALATNQILSRYIDKTINVVEDYVTDRPLSVQESLNSLFDSKIHSVAYGNYNQVAVLKESKPHKISPYISRATKSLFQATRAAFPDYQVNIVQKEEIRLFQSFGDEDLVYLGGPLSNPALAEYLGYNLAQKDAVNPEITLPKIGKKFKLRYEHYHGESTLGELAGTICTAKRYSSGNIVQRPQFAIFDHALDRFLRCDIENGWLASEYLQIVKVKDGKSNGASRIFIWGLHGHSLDAFFDEEEVAFNLDKLCEFTSGVQQFQLLLPVSLKVAQGYDNPYMKGKIEWASFKKEFLHTLDQ
jgi:hypothetical protein